MTSFFVVVGQILVLLMLVGLIKPKAAIFWGNPEKKTRGRVLLYYLGSPHETEKIVR